MSEGVGSDLVVVECLVVQVEKLSSSDDGVSFFSIVNGGEAGRR